MTAMARYTEAMAQYTETGDAIDYNSLKYYNVLCEGISTYNETTYLYNFYFVLQRLMIAATLVYA